MRLYVVATCSAHRPARTRMPPLRPLLRILSALLLAGCASGLVQPAEIRPPIRIGIAEQTAPIRFSRLMLGVQRGSAIGTYVAGFSCFGPYEPLVLTRSRDAVNDPEYIAVFEQEMSAAGYAVVSANRMFRDEEDDEARTRYHIGARITRLGVDLCRRRNIFYLLTDAGATGEASMTVEWEVFDPLSRRVVYAAASNGHAEIDEPSVAALDILTQQAFAAAVNNLAADRGFHEVLATAAVPGRIFGGSGGTGSGTAPVPAPVSGPAPGDRDRGEPIRIPALPPFTGPVSGHMEAVRAAAVMIRSGVGLGSGFFVSSDGTIVTNAHVVGASDRVGVTLPSGRALTGTVLRREPVRDVALVKVPGTGFPALPVRPTPIGVGEEVFAIGTPLLAGLQGTVTRGIVSALRRDARSGLPVIQSDVTIQHGNSGGPLVDGSGNAVGVTMSGHMDGSQRSVGLNFFIPIGDALDRLNLLVGEATAAR